MNGRPALVGLIGYKRSGKDTFAAVLSEEFDFARVAFADPLKRQALVLNPIIGRPALPGNAHPATDVRLREVIDALGWERAKDFVPGVRETLQSLGDAIRSEDPDFFVDRAQEAWTADEGRVVVTDVRQPNEAEAIQNDGGILLRITRPGLANLDDHHTEHDLDGWPVEREIVNDGTVADLAETARYFARLTL